MIMLTFKKCVCACALWFFLNSSAFALNLIEPRLTLKPGGGHGPYVALTLDACTGKTDQRILQALIGNHIRATIFVTARWLKYNSQAIAEIKAHPDLFEVENHGAMHVPAVDKPLKVFGLTAAGSPQAVAAEVAGGSAAIEKMFGYRPRWFRGATGHYSSSSKQQIEAMSFKIAGYSVLGDGGVSFSADKTARTIGNAVDGDVIVAHINQPSRPAGAGVVEGILKLKTKGFIFLRLEDGI